MPPMKRTGHILQLYRYRYIQISGYDGSMTTKLRITSAKVKVLQVMLSDPSADHWGYQLMDRSGVKSGSLYPILRQLEHARWVRSHMEAIDPDLEGRPPRRYYRLTGLGERSAASAVESFYQDLQMNPVLPRPEVAT